jgi:hypothetical protein
LSPELRARPTRAGRLVDNKGQETILSFFVL